MNECVFDMPSDRNRFGPAPVPDPHLAAAEYKEFIKWVMAQRRDAYLCREPLDGLICDRQLYAKVLAHFDFEETTGRVRDGGNLKIAGIPIIPTED